MIRTDMLRRMSASEYFEWRALERVEPFGEVGNYYRTGILASMLANMYRNRDTPAYTPLDFMPQFEAPVEKTPQELADTLAMIKKMQDMQLAQREEDAE